MVHHEDIREAQRTRPFRPFTLRLADGQSFRIAHPELMFVTRNRRTIVFEHDGHVKLLDSVLVTSLDVPGEPDGALPG